MVEPLLSRDQKADRVEPAGAGAVMRPEVKVPHQGATGVGAHGNIRELQALAGRSEDGDCATGKRNGGQGYRGERRGLSMDGPPLAPGLAEGAPGLGEIPSAVGILADVQARIHDANGA